MPIFVSVRDPPGVLRRKCLLSPYFIVVLLIKEKAVPDDDQSTGNSLFLKKGNLSHDA
jgi:hypothetical protein